MSSWNGEIVDYVSGSLKHSVSQPQSVVPHNEVVGTTSVGSVADLSSLARHDFYFAKVCDEETAIEPIVQRRFWEFPPHLEVDVSRITVMERWRIDPSDRRIDDSRHQARRATTPGDDEKVSSEVRPRSLPPVRAFDTVSFRDTLADDGSISSFFGRHKNWVGRYALENLRDWVILESRRFCPLRPHQWCA